MNDKVHPSAKPLAAADAGPKPSLPPPNSQLYNAGRPPYRPQPPPRRSRRRGCLRRCCLWTALSIFAIAVLLAIAGGLFYLIYRPRRPSISVDSLQLSAFNLTDTAVVSSFNLSLSARNPNSRISFIYDEIAVRLRSSGVDVAAGSIPGFTQAAKATTTLRAAAASSNNADSTAVSQLKSKLKTTANNLQLQIQLDTKIRAKIGRARTKKLGIRVTCDGANIAIPSGKTATSAAAISHVKCKLDPRVKIIRWVMTL
ncbi:hypothetical protein M569_06096 [Genlisea aurea]|uniref:Late embryogenesis abundant protein LEA-2 subgroup domain-containing protein n=1 Tax=Genlisea aurea TaxID=192259 RepID=S8CNB8_9LAMI|nr:hypothetical protein M569_06096 [Genlisea aurea]